MPQPNLQRPLKQRRLQRSGAQSHGTKPLKLRLKLSLRENLLG
jgi:hypothetical protein